MGGHQDADGGTDLPVGGQPLLQLVGALGLARCAQRDRRERRQQRSRLGRLVRERVRSVGEEVERAVASTLVDERDGEHAPHRRALHDQGGQLRPLRVDRDVVVELPGPSMLASRQGPSPTSFCSLSINAMTSSVAAAVVNVRSVEDADGGAVASVDDVRRRRHDHVIGLLDRASVAQPGGDRGKMLVGCWCFGHR